MRSFIPNSSTYWAYGTLAFGSALALFMYPHSVTAVLAGRTRNVIRRNAAILPTYSLMLGLLALLGYAAIAEKTKVIGQDGKPNASWWCRTSSSRSSRSWFAGVAFAAIGIGALVPAAIMSIAAANLFTRNIYREYLVRDASPAHEARVAKIVSLVVKFGALLFVLGMDRQNAINLQLLGGVWILQTILAIVAGLYTRWLHRWALLAGWAAAMVYGTVVAYHQASATTKHFGSSLAFFPGTHTKVYIAVTALLLNIIVSVVLTVILRAVEAPAGVDATEPGDYYSDSPAPRPAVAGDTAGGADHRARLTAGRAVPGGAASVGAELDPRRLDRDLADPHPDALVQALRRPVAAAAARDQRPHVLLEAVLLQAGRTAVQVLADAIAQRLVGLVVQVEVHVLEHVVAVDVARTEPHATHDSPPTPAWIRPRSRA